MAAATATQEKKETRSPWGEVLSRDQVDDDFTVTNRQPNLYEYKELPVVAFNEWDKVGQVRSILRQLRTGQFRDPSILLDQMLEDDRIYGDLHTRLNGLLGSQLEHRPPVETRAASKIAKQSERLWPQMTNAAALSDLLRYGLGLGIGVAELVWDRTDSWVPRLKVWHPQFLYFNWGDRHFYLMTEQNAAIRLPDTDREIHSDGKWVIYTPYGYQHGWYRALLRALAMPWLLRQWTYRDWARYSEAHGIPIKQLIVPAEYDVKKKGYTAQQLANIGNESVVVTPQAQDGDKYDVKLIEAMSTNYQAFQQLLTMVQQSISICVLGQDSTDRAQGGSLAQAKDKIRDDYRRFDAETLSSTLRNQMLYWWTLYNFNNAKFTPELIYDVEPSEDEEQEAKALNQLAQALPNLDAAGADVHAILDAHGIPVRAEAMEQADDESGSPGPGGSGFSQKQPSISAGTTEHIMSVNEARKLHGLGPMMDGDKPHKDGDLSVAEYKRKNTPEEEQPGFMAKQIASGKAPQPGPPQKLSEGADAFKLASPDPAGFIDFNAGTPDRRPKYAKKRAAKYVNRLTTKAQQRAQEALSVDLMQLRADIAASRSPDELEKRLVMRFKHMNPSQLARVIERARIMAQLDGHHQVLRNV